MEELPHHHAKPTDRLRMADAHHITAGGLLAQFRDHVVVVLLLAGRDDERFRRPLGLQRNAKRVKHVHELGLALAQLLVAVVGLCEQLGQPSTFLQAGVRGPRSAGSRRGTRRRPTLCTWQGIRCVLTCAPLFVDEPQHVWSVSIKVMFWKVASSDPTNVSQRPMHSFRWPSAGGGGGDGSDD